MYSPYKRHRTSSNSTNGGITDSMIRKMSIPKNMDRTGSFTGYYGTQRRPKGRRTNTFTYKIRQAETVKHYIKSDATLNQTLVMNTAYVHSPTAQVTQGDANNSRDGDNMYLCALKIRYLFQDLVAIVDGVTYRVLVGYNNVQYSASGFTTGTTSDYFFPSAGTYFSNYIVDPKKFTVLLDKTIDQNTLLTGVKPVASDAVTIPLEKPFTYATNTQFGKNTNLTIILLAQVIGGTTGSTQVGNAYMGYDLIFKNSK